MQLEELRNKILEARQQRWDFLSVLTEFAECGCFITVTGNTAGTEKDNPVMRQLITCAEKRMTETATALTVGSYTDAAGYIVFMHSALDTKPAKLAAVAIETESEWNRLLDIDIYGTDGQTADRSSLGLNPRKCLVCGESAADCIRTQRHEYADIIAETHRLLKRFQGSC